MTPDRSIPNCETLFSGRSLRYIGSSCAISKTHDFCFDYYACPLRYFGTFCYHCGHGTWHKKCRGRGPCCKRCCKPSPVVWCKPTTSIASTAISGITGLLGGTSNTDNKNAT